MFCSRRSRQKELKKQKQNTRVLVSYRNTVFLPQSATNSVKKSKGDTEDDDEWSEEEKNRLTDALKRYSLIYKIMC